MSDPEAPAHSMPATFFRPLASNLLDDILGVDTPPSAGVARQNADRAERVDVIAKVLQDTFESGLASSLVGIVSAIEAVRVPRGGMLFVKVPFDSMSRIDFLRADLKRVSSILTERLGFQPLIMVIPFEAAVETVDFETAAETVDFEPDAEPSNVVQLHPGIVAQPSDAARKPRFALLDPLAFREVVEDSLPTDLSGKVTVIPMGCTVVEGVTVHDLRVVLADTDTDLIQGFANVLRGRFLREARRLNARLVVLVLLESGLEHADKLSFVAGQDVLDWVLPSSARFVVDGTVPLAAE